MIWIEVGRVRAVVQMAALADKPPLAPPKEFRPGGRGQICRKMATSGIALFTGKSVGYELASWATVPVCWLVSPEDNHLFSIRARQTVLHLPGSISVMLFQANGIRISHGSPSAAMELQL